MDNPKFENLLNLALDATEREREKSIQLGVGYEPEENTWDLIVKYSGSLERLREDYPSIQVREMINEYAILRVPQSLIDVIAQAEEIEYVEKPKRLYFAVNEGKRASCITPLQTAAYHLTGQGVLVALLDSGIDYAHPDFRNEDGSTRILELWDQTMDRVFKKPEIDEALAAPTEAERYRLVPSRDLSGHGTHVAGIAAGNGRASGGRYRGVAYESSLLVVKLGTPREQSFPRTTELMEALNFVIKRALEYRMPVAVNISFGNTYGSHSGTSLLETFIDDISSYWKSVIAIGTGNEGSGRGHTSGTVSENQQEMIELAVGTYETSISVQIWKSYVDEFDIILEHPNGQRVGPLSQNLAPQRLILADTEILVYYGEPSPYSVYQEIYLDFIPRQDYIDSGVWKFYLVPKRVVLGNYDMWLPSQAALNRSTGFLYPVDDTTLTIPSTASKAISVGAYDARYQQFAEFSGRGFTRQTRQVKPDIAAPGVDITSAAPGDTYASRSGTSMATPFVTGSAALMMQWGIVEGNDPFLYDAVIIGLS
ncbi:MAG: S8 family peptidase [Lachnospiraceae bacterium]|nr:S8 family peptidase [Lachnospiraceae bacterium]